MGSRSSIGSRHTAQEPGPWSVLERIGFAIPAGDDGEQGDAGGGRERFGVDGEMGTGAGRVPGEAEELVWDLLEREWWDSPLEKLGDS